MSFPTAFTGLSPTRQSSLTTVLAAWDGSGDLPALAAANLRGELGAAPAALTTYLTELADHHGELGLGPPGPRTAFERIGVSFALAGYEATTANGALFGRAILLKKFARYLSDTFAANPDLLCDDEFDEVVSNLRLLRDKQEGAVKPALRNYFTGIRRTFLGKGAVFATFILPVVPGRRPWTVPSQSAGDVRSAVALGEDPPGEDYLLFVYSLPPSHSPLVPTTASPGWAYQRWFRPNPTAVADRHGWTVPLNPTAPARPEVVHEQLLGTTVAFPIHVAAA